LTEAVHQKGDFGVPSGAIQRNKLIIAYKPPQILD
jgi:hypothetical protein